MDAPRIVGMRQHFQAPEPPAWRGRLAVALLILTIVQLGILFGHWLWLAEVWFLTHLPISK
jgi:hypothetical protein